MTNEERKTALDALKKCWKPGPGGIYALDRQRTWDFVGTYEETIRHVLEAAMKTDEKTGVDVDIELMMQASNSIRGEGYDEYADTVDQAIERIKNKIQSFEKICGVDNDEYCIVKKDYLASRNLIGQSVGRHDKADLTKCPQCRGPADNGFDRCDPPSPYYCSKCSDALSQNDGEV